MIYTIYTVNILLNSYYACASPRMNSEKAPFGAFSIHCKSRIPGHFFKYL